jgi:hypothetical protein
MDAAIAASSEGLVQIGAEVLRVLQTDGDAKDPVTGPRSIARQVVVAEPKGILLQVVRRQIADQAAMMS